MVKKTLKSVHIPSYNGVYNTSKTVRKTAKAVTKFHIDVQGEKIKYKGTNMHSWNIFVPGTRVGAHKFMRYNKQYAYVCLPKSNNWVFLRTAVFLEVENTGKFVIVHDVGYEGDHTWDVPKGQVEYKEYETIKNHHKTTHDRVKALLKEGISRELEEEAKISIDDVMNLRMVPNLSVGGKHKDLPQNFVYLYQIFEGQITEATYKKATQKIAHMRKYPELTVDMKKDVIEKDDITLWSPSDGLSKMGKGDPTDIAKLYMAYKGLK